MDPFDANMNDGLTEPQLAAVMHTEGPLLVLAGPGSGKTSVVTRRIVNLVRVGIPPWNVLAVTFTNKAAGEMRERVGRLLPEDLPGRRGLTIATFHAFCARTLRSWGDRVGLSERFTIYDSGDQREAIRQSIKDAELSVKNFTAPAVAATISGVKNRLLDAAAYQAESNDFYSRSMARAYTVYERRLRANDAVDFDDLLFFVARLLRTCDEARQAMQERYQYLLIDEYQDTNHAQFVIASAIAATHGNICVVGDPDQSIYGWRGADIRNILEFEERYPEAQVIPLGQNFRSTGHIVAIADHLIQHNQRRKHKPLHTELGDGNKPVVLTCRDEEHEAVTVVRELRALHDDESLPWKEMAVLYRMNALSRVLEDAFRDAQIPYVIARGTAFYERKEIKDALSYLRLIVNPRDEIALRRIVNTPTRGIGKTTLQRIEFFALQQGIHLVEACGRAREVEGLSARAIKSVDAFAQMVASWRTAAAVITDDELALARLFERIVKESGLERLFRTSNTEDDIERLENLEELINAGAKFAPVVEESADEEEPALETLAQRLAAYLESVALVSDADAIDPAAGTVTLMTLHAAKGLEFDAVAVVALEEGMLPHMRAADNDAELEEERRLCFVGITRARRHLMLTRVMSRTHRGMRERRMESQFIGQLPSAHIVATDLAGFDDDVYQPSRHDLRGVLSAFPAGSLVRHPTFGVGRVESVSPRPTGASARVAFSAVGRKTLILEYANLERIDETDAWDI